MTPALPPRVRAVVEAVAAEHRLPEAALFGRAKRRAVAHPRQQAWARIRALDGPLGKPFSLARIGAWFGRDHSTVLDGVRAYERRTADGA